MFFGHLGYSSRDLDFMSMRELINANNGYNKKLKQDYLIRRQLAYVIAAPHYKQNMFKPNNVLPDSFFDSESKHKDIKYAKIEKVDGN